MQTSPSSALPANFPRSESKSRHHLSDWFIKLFLRRLPHLYLYLYFGVDDSIVYDFTQRGDHNSGPMRNPKLTDCMVM